MKIAILLAVVLMTLGGCKGTGPAGARADARAQREDRVLLTFDFDPNQTLRYRFVSHRNILLDLDPEADTDEGRLQRQSERLEMVVAYTPVEVDFDGISTIVASCESVQIVRTGRPSGRGLDTDAVVTAQGKSYTITVDPRGRIVDASDLDRLIRELGAAAFRPDTSRGRIKEPDLVGDFVASQWFLWDAVSSIEPPSAGVAVGQSWQSTLSVPTPMVMRKARDVTYRLTETRAADSGRLAVIDGTYTLAESAPQDWPIPYSGRFQLSGAFGFLGAYDIVALQGQGRTLFNIDVGRIEREEQQYTLQMKASLEPMGIRVNPFITIEQTLTMERLEEQS